MLRNSTYHDLDRLSKVTHISAYKLAKLVSLMAFSNTNSIIFSSSALEPTDTSHIWNEGKKGGRKEGRKERK